MTKALGFWLVAALSGAVVSGGCRRLREWRIDKRALAATRAIPLAQSRRALEAPRPRARILVDKAKQPDRVKIKLAHGSIEVTLAEGARIRDVVADALARSPKDDYRDASRRLRGDTVHIDPSGSMRMGEWVLDRRDDDVVLQRARWVGGGLHMIVAHLRRAGDGAYSVPQLDEEMYHGSPEGH